MRLPIRLLILMAVLAAATPAFAQAPPPEDTHLEAALLWWEPTPTITISSGDLSSDVDFVNDLGIEKKRFREVRVGVRAGKSKIRFAYIPVRYAEEGKVLNRTIVFRGVTYNVNLPVNTALNWDYYRFAYEYDLVRGAHGLVGIVADLKYNKIDAQITSPVGDERTEQTVPVPTLGGIARVYLGQYVSATGEFTAFKLTKTDLNGKFYDLDLYGQLNLNQSFAIQGGYRSINADYLVDDDTGDLKLEGLYFGGVVRF
jgi:hypothetical protein